MAEEMGIGRAEQVYLQQLFTIVLHELRIEFENLVALIDVATADRSP